MKAYKCDSCGQFELGEAGQSPIVPDMDLCPRCRRAPAYGGDRLSSLEDRVSDLEERMAWHRHSLRFSDGKAIDTNAVGNPVSQEKGT